MYAQCPDSGIKQSQFILWKFPCSNPNFHMLIHYSYIDLERTSILFRDEILFLKILRQLDFQNSKLFSVFFKIEFYELFEISNWKCDMTK